MVIMSPILHCFWDIVRYW